MRKTLSALAVTALALAGCSSNVSEDEATVSATTALSTSMTTTDATPTSETSAKTQEPEAPVEQQESQSEAVPAEQPAVQAPTVVGCANHGGTALMSDGSTAYSASCDENANGLVPGNTGNAYDPPVTADNNYNPDTARIAGQNWWGECIAANTAEYCQANDPYQ